MEASKQEELYIIPGPTKGPTPIIQEIYPITIELGGTPAALAIAQQAFMKLLISEPDLNDGEEDLVRELAKRNMISPVQVGGVGAFEKPGEYHPRPYPTSVTVVARSADTVLKTLSGINTTVSENGWTLDPPMKKIVEELRKINSNLGSPAL